MKSPLANAHKVNVLMNTITDQQAAEHIELTIWEAGFDVDPNTDVWHSKEENSYVILNRCSMTLVVSIEEAQIEIPVTVSIDDEEWLLSRNNIDALINMNIEVLRQSINNVGGQA